MTDTQPPLLDASIFFAKGSRPAQPLQGQGFLVHGARAAGKTSLAFQAVVNTVHDTSGSSRGGSGSNDGAEPHVVVLCQESVFYAKVPVPFTPLSALPDSSLNHIEFVYVSSWQGTLRELMELRTTQSVPPLLLIDDDGFETAAAPLATGQLRRGGQQADALASTTAAAACLSYLANLHDWMTRNEKPFSYVVVTNQLPESATLLPLPFGAFPVVNVWVGASGVVQMTPVAFDRAVVAPAYVTWRNGLQLR